MDFHERGVLRVTPVHQPIWMRNETYTGWLRNPGELKLGDEIFHVQSNSWVKVKYLREQTGSFQVYDIWTDPLNVFVGNGILLDYKQQ